MFQYQQRLFDKKKKVEALVSFRLATVKRENYLKPITEENLFHGNQLDVEFVIIKILGVCKKKI
jgi:hypothetical protein